MSVEEQDRASGSQASGEHRSAAGSSPPDGEDQDSVGGPPSGKNERTAVGPPPGGDERDDVKIRPVLWTTILVGATAAVGHIGLYAFFPHSPDQLISIGPTVFVGTSVALVGIIAFGGFYIASGRARVAIAASFLLTFLLCLTFALAVVQFGDFADAQNIFGRFLDYVTVIMGFYFGSEAAISIAKVFGISSVARSGGDPASREAIKAVDRA